MVESPHIACTGRAGPARVHRDSAVYVTLRRTRGDARITTKLLSRSGLRPSSLSTQTLSDVTP